MLLPRRLVLVGILALLSWGPAAADTFWIDASADTGTGSFYEAIGSANANAGADTIAFLTPGRIEPSYWGLPPVITDDLTIIGPESGRLVIDGDALPQTEAVLRVRGAFLDISNVSFENARAGAIAVTAGGSLIAKGVTITNSVAHWSMISAHGADSVTVSNSIFKDNRLMTSVIGVSHSENLLVSDTVFSGNTSFGNSALSVTASSVSLNNVDISDNESTSEDFSGAVLFDDAAVEISGSRLIGNVGGAMHVQSRGAHVLTIRDSVLSGNSSKRNGAVLVAGGDPVIEITGSVMERNATSGSGGALSVSNATLTINQSHFYRNSSGNSGGALSMVSGEATISGSSFVENRAGRNFDEEGSSGGSGGALYIGSGAAVSVEDSLFRSNRAAASGGAIYAYRSTLGMMNALLEKNGAKMSGGAIGYGGWGQDGGALELSGVMVRENKAPAGAGLHVYLDEGQRLAVTKSSISGNVSSDGPAVSVEGHIATNVQISQSTLADNQGGGLASAIDITGGSEPDSEALITNSTFSGNRSGKRRAAISIGAIDAVLIDSSTFMDNEGATDDSVQLQIWGAMESGEVIGLQVVTEAEIINSIFSSGNQAEIFFGNRTDYPFYQANLPSAIVEGGICLNGYSYNANADITAGVCVSVDPSLGPLQHSGGLTRTHAPLDTSAPGVDAGITARPDGLDQRGAIEYGSNDFGAVEHLPTNAGAPRLTANLWSRLSGKAGEVLEDIKVAGLFDDPDGVETIRVTGLPTGLAYDQGTDMISGALERDGQYYVTVTVSDQGAPALETTIQGVVEVRSGSAVLAAGGGGGGGGSMSGAMLLMLVLTGWRRATSLSRRGWSASTAAGCTA
jgi:hypothetical protein